MAPDVMPMRRTLARLAVLLGVLQLQVHAQAPLPAPLEEVPFITSPDNVTLEMLSAAGVRQGDHVIDLGSGDGRIVILAARRFGATGLGVEIDPQLVERSRRNARDAGVADRAEFREQDLFKTDLSRASVITMYLLQEVNMALRPSLLALRPGTRVVSHDWDMGDWQPDATTTVPVPDKAVGREKLSRIHLWVVPARVEGLWCGSGAWRGSSLRLSQRHQFVEGTLTRREGEVVRTRAMRGRIDGAAVALMGAGGAGGAVALRAAGDALQAEPGAGPLAGALLRRAAGASCEG